MTDAFVKIGIQATRPVHGGNRASGGAPRNFQSDIQKIVRRRNHQSSPVFLAETRRDLAKFLRRARSAIFAKAPCMRILLRCGVDVASRGPFEQSSWIRRCT